MNQEELLKAHEDLLGRKLAVAVEEALRRYDCNECAAFAVKEEVLHKLIAGAHKREEALHKIIAEVTAELEEVHTKYLDHLTQQAVKK